jgi:hypothetical protein
MTERYQGMLGAVTEACDIHREEGAPLEEAFREQERRAKRRLLAYRRRKNREARLRASDSNVIPFRR